MKNKKPSISDFIKFKKKQREKYKRAATISIDHINKIKKHHSSKIIFYPEYKDSFDYVDKIFPKAKVKNVSILIADRKFLDSLGYSSAKGFFNRLEGTIVLPNTDKIDNNKAWKKVVSLSKQDETIVHELLHFVSSTLSSPPTSMLAEEEFAYGYSINYLRSKGYSDEYIIKNIFMPYLINDAIDKSKIARIALVKYGYDLKKFAMLSDNKQDEVLNELVDKEDVYSMIVDEAEKKGKELVDIYTRKIIHTHEEYNDIEKTKYDLLDI